MAEKKMIAKIMAGTIGTIALSSTLLLLSGCSETSAKKELKLGDGKGTITLKDTITSIQGSGMKNHDRVVEITKGGTYEVSGTLENGQIYIEAPSDEIVELTLKDVTMENESEAAIYVKNAGLTKIIVDKDSKNRIACGKEIQKEKLEETLNNSEEASGAAIYAKDDLTLLGTGSLEVNGYINNGIFTKNDLVIEDGNYTVTALNNGMKGEETVTIKNGTMNLAVGKDGVKAEKEIVIKNGTITIPYCNEGIEANQVTIEDGDIDIVSSDDGINANGGTSNFGKNDKKNRMKNNVSENHSDTNADAATEEKQAEPSKDGGMPQPPQMGENGEKLQAPEGEAPQMPEGGEVPQAPEGEAPQIPEDGKVPQAPNDEKSQASNEGKSQAENGEVAKKQEDTNKSSEEETVTETPNLTIRGGNIMISSSGDGLDSNGNILVEGGTIVIEGASNGGNGALDYSAESGGNCTINGGTVLALGQSGMAEKFDDASKQCSFIHNYVENVEAGAELKICDENGDLIYKYTWKKGGNSIVFSSAKLKQGNKYTLYSGKEALEISLDQIVTQSGEQSNGFGRGFMKNFGNDKKYEKRNQTNENVS